LIEIHPESKTELLQKSRNAVDQAREFYESGIEEDPTNHWTAMQYLSLKAVSEGNLNEDIGPWHIVKYMAEREERRASNETDKMWAWGTLAELYMLQPLIAPDHPAEQQIESSIALSIGYIEKMADARQEFNSVKESTARQFERYIEWWPLLFSEVYPTWLKNAATRIRSKLPALELL
jgi:hypothetical protein